MSDPADTDKVTGPRKWHFLFLLLLGALTAAAFVNAAHDTFVNDDQFFVPQKAAFGARSLLRMFRENAWAGVGIDSDLYRPLFLFSLIVEATVHGVRARWFHVTNIVVHGVTTIALFQLLRALLRGSAEDGLRNSVASSDSELPRAVSPRAEPDASILPAFLAALLFGLHPVHTEVVDSVFNRSEMLATLGVLGATWVVWRFVPTHPIWAWTGAAIIYFAALLCRESAAVLPFLVLLIVCSLRPTLATTRAGRRRLLPALLLVVVAVVYLLLRLWALTPNGSISRDAPAAFFQGFSLERLGLGLGLLREGLRFIIWPHPLRAVHSEVGAAGLLPTLLFHGLILGAAVLARRTAPGFLLGLSFFYVALLPSTRILAGSVSVALAERYLYLPSVGLALALAFLLRQANAALGARKRWITMAVAAVAGLFFVLTTSRNADWSNDETLWGAEARRAPNSSLPWALLSAAYFQNGRPADAARICDERLPLHQRSSKLYTNCAITYENLRRLDEAERAYRHVVELGLGATAHANLARFYDNTGRRKQAEREYLQAIEVERAPVVQHYRRAQFILRFHPQRFVEAERELQRALQLQPRYAPARQALDALHASYPSTAWPSER